ncbi:hypothetical protein INR38_09145 [Delftia sp. SD018]|uniref:hypothetical protein n=1 Tax=Delftia sp. SD018 TaxID=2781389 RepID=UPI001A96AC8B|nr:hypothetical protein [Delftia sp. SD018]MBO1034251.1 hypothetical protein [Delftia sp. SD018]
MNTICMNTMTGAVTEYDGFAFQSITPRYAGSVNGLFGLGGDSDAGQPIQAEVLTGRMLWGDARKKFAPTVWFSMLGTGAGAGAGVEEGELLVQGQSGSWVYRFAVRPAGESRAQPGRGIRENYLAFGYRNVDGVDFQIDLIEVGDVSSKRRV